MGLLDWIDTPGGQGLLAAGLGALGSRTALGGISRGGLLGLQTYAGAQDRQKFDARQKSMDDRSGQMFDLQMSQHQAALQKAQQQAEQQKMQQNYIGGIGQVTSPRIGAEPNKPDPYRMLSMGMGPDMVKTVMEAPNMGRAEVARTVEVDDGQGGKATVQLDRFGQPVGGNLPSYIAPVQVDTGGKVQFVKPQAGVNLTKSMTPGERDTSARGWAGVRLQREQAAKENQAVTYQQDADGNFVALPTKIQPGSVVRGTPVVAGPGMIPLKGASKMGEGQKKQISGIESLSNAVDAYASAVDQWDTKKFINPNERAKMGTLYNNMMLQAKEAYNLGVLNGPDYDILQAVIKDPTSAGSLMVSKDTLKGQATTLRNMLQGNVSSIKNPGQQQPGAAQSPAKPSVSNW